MASRLASIWADLLEVPPPSIDQDLFDLGMDSITAMLMLAKIHDETGVELPIEVVFEASTFSELAAVIEETGRTR